AHIADMESRLRAIQVAQRRGKAPLQRRAAEGTVDHVIAQYGQMQDSCFITFRGAGEVLEPIERNGWNQAVMCVDKAEVARYLGTRRLCVVVVEDQPVNIARQVLNRARDAGLR